MILKLEQGIRTTFRKVSKSIYFLVFQDVISIFFPKGLTEEEGILKHLRLDPKFLRKCQTTKNITAIHSFINTLAHYYSLALGEEKLTGVRTGKLGMCPEEKKKILERIAEDIVADVWPQIDSDSLDSVRQGNEPVADRGNENVFKPNSITSPVVNARGFSMFQRIRRNMSITEQRMMIEEKEMY